MFDVEFAALQVRTNWPALSPTPLPAKLQAAIDLANAVVAATRVPKDINLDSLEANPAVAVNRIEQAAIDEMTSEYFGRVKQRLEAQCAGRVIKAAHANSGSVLTALRDKGGVNAAIKTYTTNIKLLPNPFGINKSVHCFTSKEMLADATTANAYIACRDAEKVINTATAFLFEAATLPISGLPEFDHVTSITSPKAPTELYGLDAAVMVYEDLDPVLSNAAIKNIPIEPKLSQAALDLRKNIDALALLERERRIAAGAR